MPLESQGGHVDPTFLSIYFIYLFLELILGAAWKKYRKQYTK